MEISNIFELNKFKLKDEFKQAYNDCGWWAIQPIRSINNVTTNRI